jgi:HNH endonuclease
VLHLIGYRTVAREVTARKPRRTTPSGTGLDSQAWRVLKSKHKSYSRSRDLPCWYAEHGKCVLGGAPIDYDAPHSTPYAYETDHKKPRSTHPGLLLAWNNLRASHCRCNRTHQARNVVAQQDWVRPKF